MLGRLFVLIFLTKSITPQTVTLLPGSTVNVSADKSQTFTCTTTYQMRFVFFYDSTLTSGTTAVTLGNINGDCQELGESTGYIIECDSVNGPYKFTIISVTRKYHKRKITCRIQYGSSSTDDIADAASTILVNAAPVINEFTPGGIVTKNESDTQLFQCSASGFPKAAIAWHIDRSTPTTAAPPINTIQGENATSIIEYIAQKTDNGKTIKCTASNGIESVSANATLVVQYIPAVEVSPSFNPFNVIENTTDFQLTCIVKEAFPNVTSYRWYKNGSVISRDAKLIIEKVTRSNGGIYTCDATNQAGSSIETSKMPLNVLYGVIMNTIMALQPIEGNTLSVNCTGESNPAIEMNEVTWTKQNNDTFTKKGIQLIIENINRQDSGTYICTVVKRLTDSGGQFIDVTGTTSVKLDVIYMPVVKVSPIYNPFDVIENTTDLNLTCTVKEAYPNVTSYRWYTKGSIISRDATYKIPKVKKSNGGIYTCDATNKVGTSDNASAIALNVLYGVIVNTINTQQPIEGKVLNISCTGQSNPAIKEIDVTWTKLENKTFTQTGKQLMIHNVNRLDSGSYICTVVLTLTSSDKQSINVSGSTLVDVDVLYHPEVEIIPGYTPYNVIENTTNIQLNCRVKDANPAVETYLWKKDGTNMSSNASFQIPFVQRSDGGIYTCYAINKVGNSEPSLKLIVKVLYGVIVTTIGLNQPIEGSYLSVNCTGDSYPPVEENEIIWTKKNNNTFKQEGKQLIIPNVRRLDNGSYICTVNKSLTSSAGSITVVTGTNTVKVNVLYLPTIEIITNKNVEIQENSTDLKLTCFVKAANPEVEEYKWYKDGELISQQQNENFRLNTVYRSDAGYYTCEGINSVGASNSTFFEVNVLYGVTLNLSRNRISVNESDKLSVICTAIGNPLPTLSWINTYNNSVITEKDNVDANAITVVNANCIDTGIYTCIGNNSIGDFAFYSIVVHVECHPRTIDNKDIRTIVVNGIGGVLSISEVFISFPHSDVTWSRRTQDDNNTVLDNQFDISDNKSILPFGTVSNLYKDDMKREEFGTYAAIAVNDYGSFVVIYNVIPKGKPDPPTNVGAICGITSITVTWMSRFDGGDNQTFRIYFHNIDSNTTTLSSGDKQDEREGSYISLKEESLTPNSIYEIYVEAKNSFGGINSTEVATCKTAKRNEKESTSSALVGGVAGTSSLIVVFVAVVITFIIHRRKIQGEDKKPFKRCSHHTVEDEDGLKDNPLYGTSEQPTNFGGENIKTDTKPIEEGLEEGPVYSKVEKIGRKGKKEKHEKKQKNGQHHKDIEMGTVYENSDKLMKDEGDEEVYENASTGKEIGQTVYTGNQYKSRKNKDGLIYADLDLAPQPSGKRFVIRGLENRNNYAVIDLSKTADPLPSDSDEEDTVNINNIKN